jgi:hypothetical protein
MRRSLPQDADGDGKRGGPRLDGRRAFARCFCGVGALESAPRKCKLAREGMSHLALSDEDGGYELRVGMPTPMKIAHDCLNVKWHAAVCGHWLIVAVFKEKPAGGAGGAGESRTTRIEGTDTADGTISGRMSMARR